MNISLIRLRLQFYIIFIITKSSNISNPHIFPPLHYDKYIARNIFRFENISTQITFFEREASSSI